MFDSHVHYDHKRFDNGRDELLQKMHENGLEFCLNAAIGFDSNERMMKLFEKYPWIYFAVGIHPNAVEAGKENDERYSKQLSEWMKMERVKAIGETGLDYYRLEQAAENDATFDLGNGKERQKEWFRKLLSMAKESGLPLILHVRGDVHEEVFHILDECKFEGMRGVIHCFHGSFELANEYLKRGFLIGIGGMITRQGMDEFREAVKKIPLEQILLETDSPFVRPEGMEGKRNTSESLSVIAEEIARIKGEDIVYVKKVIFQNTKKMFLSESLK